MDVLNPYEYGMTRGGDQKRHLGYLEGSNPKGYISTPGPNRDGEHMMGTTIMAVAYDGGVIIGADSRTSAGSYVANRVSDKLTKIGERIYCCRSGSAADTQAVADIVKYYMSMHKLESNKQFPKVAVAAQMFKGICYGNKDRLLAGIICAGWDPVDGGSVWSIPLGGSCVKQPYALGGSGSTYIYGYCDANYKKGMNKEECMKFISTAISHAMSRDGSSGGVIRMRVLSKDGNESHFISGDKLPFMSDEN